MWSPSESHEAGRYYLQKSHGSRERYGGVGEGDLEQGFNGGEERPGGSAVCHHLSHLVARGQKPLCLSPGPPPLAHSPPSPSFASLAKPPRRPPSPASLPWPAVAVTSLHNRPIISLKLCSDIAALLLAPSPASSARPRPRPPSPMSPQYQSSPRAERRRRARAAAFK